MRRLANLPADLLVCRFVDLLICRFADSPIPTGGLP
jgi:hypothetical protein